MTESNLAPRAPRFTLWRVLRLLFATAIALFIGFIGFGMWLPNLMTFAPVMDGESGSWLFQLIMVNMFAGPFIAGGSLLIGWIVFFFKPVAGIRIVALPPILWGMSIFLIFIVSLSFFDGAFDWLA